MKVLQAENSRDYPRIPPKPHLRRQRGTQLYSPLRRCRLPCLGRKHRYHCQVRIPRAEIRQPEGRLLSPSRARHTKRRRREYPAAYAITSRRTGEGGCDAICGEYPEVEGTRALQGQGYLCGRGDDQAQEQEDQISISRYALYLCTIYVQAPLYWNAGNCHKIMDQTRLPPVQHFKLITWNISADSFYTRKHKHSSSTTKRPRPRQRNCNR